MTSQGLKKLKLPDTPGIYIFRDRKRRPLYIGRATSLKDRVRSYFGPDLIETRGARVVDMVTKARTVTYQSTDSVLEAVLLECRLIKSYQPFYNVDERDDKSSNYVIITDEAWPRVFLARARDMEAKLKGAEVLTASGKPAYVIKKKFGPFPESGLIRETMQILRKLFPFKDKKALDPRHELFYRSIGRSPDGDDARARRRYLITIGYLELFFEGKKSRIRQQLRSDMNRQASILEFEAAGRSKRLLYALDHINDISLIGKQEGGSGEKRERAKDFRIEAYDIAHLAGENVVGAMAVSVSGKPMNSEYRKFKLSRERNDDIAGLVEILSRRLNHSEWRYPDLIVVDGNENQFKAAKAVLSSRRIDIPVVGVTKDKRHKAAKIIGDLRFAKTREREIVAVNSEAHRFALKYHRNRRSRR